MATDARGHTVPASTDHPSRAALTALSLSIDDPIPVANVTARATLITTLTGLGITASTANPITVWRADAPYGFQTEFTTDGSNWTPLGAVGSTMGTPTTTATAGTATTGTTETRDDVLGLYPAFTALAGVRYEVRLNGMTLYCNTAADRFLVNVRNGGASVPSAASPLIASTQVNAASVTNWPCPIAASFVPGAGVVRLGVFAQRVAGAGVGQPTGTRELYVVNLGPA